MYRTTMGSESARRVRCRDAATARWLFLGYEALGPMRRLRASPDNPHLKGQLADSAGLRAASDDGDLESDLRGTQKST